MSSGVDVDAGLVAADAVIAGTRWRIATRLPASDHRPPLLLCNGIGVNWQAFEPLIELFADRPLIAFDVPGVGASAPPPHPYTMSALATRVQSLLSELGVREVDVLGVSWGGALAQQFALQAGTRCRRLVLAATSTGMFSVPGRLAALLQLSDARRFRADGQNAQALAEAYGGRVRHDFAAMQRYLGRLVAPNAEGYRCQLLALGGWTSLPWLACMSQRTLLLAGRDDPLVPPANALLMHALMRRSSLELVDDGHLLLHTRAAELGPRIASFLDDPS
jgi:poly(3-hydroxyalkanoate) depolymerase